MSVLAFGDWTFERRGGLCRMRGAQGIALAASAAGIDSGIAGVDTLGVPDAVWPAGADEQSMRLRFRSNGFFDGEPEAHFALGVAGQWRKAAPALHAPGLATGRGLVVGNVSLAPNGGAQAPIVQIESFHVHGNALLPGTCSPRLDEGRWYALEFSATAAGRIAYRLESADDAAPLAECAIDDDSGEVPAGLGGWWILHAFSDRHPERDWTFDIAGLEIRWR